jgi:hypothetical protein
MAFDRVHIHITRAISALLRRVFCRCQGRAVNHMSRQMTPEEAVDLRVCLNAHGVQDRKGSSVNEAPSHSGTGG